MWWKKIEGQRSTRAAMKSLDFDYTLLIVTPHVVPVADSEVHTIIFIDIPVFGVHRKPGNGDFHAVLIGKCDFVHSAK